MPHHHRRRTTRHVTFGPLWGRLRLLALLGLAACEAAPDTAVDVQGEASRAALTSTVSVTAVAPSPGSGSQSSAVAIAAASGAITATWPAGQVAPPNAISAVSLAPGSFQLFARASDGSLITKRIEATVEHDWESLGGDIASAPTAVSPAPGQIEVFVRSRKAELYRLSYRQGRWADWESLGGSLQGTPSAASWGGGRVDVFARTLDGRLVRRVLAEGRWQPWESLGQSPSFDPVAASSGAGRIDLVVRDGNGQLLHRHVAAGVWSPWRAEGGVLTTDPSLTSPEPGRLELLARNSDQLMVARSFAGGVWGPWRTLGDRIDSAPMVLATRGGRLDAFARAPNNRLLRRTFSGGVWGGPLLGAAVASAPAWGVADLHAHPASHLSFGAGAGGGGIMWGSPGLALDPTGASVTRDLPPCPQDKHVGEDTDWVRHLTRSSVINQVNGLTGHPHGNGGDGRYTNWPHALSLSHQQMHVSFLHRAYQGGVRLVFASVTDNQTLSMMWHRHIDWSHDLSMPRPGLEDDYQSARRQLSFIRQLAAANPTWMEVVTSPQAARAALRANKLALVLALELDKLTVDQILALQREFGVASANPVHLADNDFGGAAVYSDVFNTSNWWLNGTFFTVRGNPLLKFRLSNPQYLRIEYENILARGAVEPRAWEHRSHFCSVLGYEPCADRGTAGIPWSHGHENVLGISRAPMRRLLEAGLLVDVSHMGVQSTAETLTLAEEVDYPLIASHGGLRGDGEQAESERNMLDSHGLRLSQLGGVFGMGTEGHIGADVAAVDVGAPLVRLSGERRSWTRSLIPAQSAPAPIGIPTLWVTVRTGGDDLRGGNDNAQAVVTYRDARGVLQTQRSGLNGTQRWADNTTNTAFVWLPVGTLPSQIESFGIETSFGGGIGGDNWNVDDLRVVYQAGTRVEELFQRTGTPFFRFTGDRRSFTERFVRSHPWTAPLRSLHLTVVTGGDDLRGGNDNAYATVTFTDGVRIESPVNGGGRLGDNSTHRVPLTIREGATLEQVSTVSMRTTFSGGVGGDNWNVDEIVLEYVTMAGQAGTLSRKVGAPYVRFTNSRQHEIAYVKPAQPLDPTLDASVLRISVRTGDDDLRAGSQASLTVRLRPGLTSSPVTVPFNEGGVLPNGSTFSRIVRLPAGTRVADLVSLTIDSAGSGVALGETYDNWNIDQVTVEVLRDPLGPWIEEYRSIRRKTVGAGLALGTDLNGLARQMPFTTRAVPPQITVARDRAPVAARPSVPTLSRHTLGVHRIFDFEKDGIAHYGMLPDFLQAIAGSSEGREVVDSLFHSAEDTIRAWERARMARARVVGPTP